MDNRNFIKSTSIYLGLLGVFLLGILSERINLIEDMTVNYREDIIFLTGDHLYLVAVSSGLAIVAGIPVGIWLSRPRMLRLSENIMQVFNIGTTIPTLAILALSMSFLGIGKTPAIFALWIATLLPIIRNTFVGLTAVPKFLIEAATGMGMTPGQILLRVEIPNALYVIFAGIRTALAINVGTVPLAFLIGAGGLGELIFTGIDLDEIGMMLSGAIPVALLAIATDFVVSQLQHWTVPKGVNPNG